MSNLAKHSRAGEAAFAKMEKVNAELFTMTYGSLVVQLMKDLEDVEAVNTALEKMGYGIGVRLIDEFLATSGVGRCGSFRETAEVIAKVGFRMFLNMPVEVTAWNEEETECSLILNSNPLNSFVELPEAHRGLWYSNVYCGVIRGALELVQNKVEVTFVKDVLRGDGASEIRLKLIEVMQEEVPPGED